MAGANPLKPGTTDPDREGTVYDEGSPNDIYNKSYKGKNDKVYFYQQLRDAVKNGADTKEQGEVIRRLQHIVNTAYGKEAAQAGITLNVPIHGKVLYRLKHKDTGAVVYKAADVYYNSYISDFDSPEEKAYKQEMNKYFPSASVTTGPSVTAGPSSLPGKRNCIGAMKPLPSIRPKKLGAITARTMKWGRPTVPWTEAACGVM